MVLNGFALFLIVCVMFNVFEVSALVDRVDGLSFFVSLCFDMFDILRWLKFCIFERLRCLKCLRVFWSLIFRRPMYVCIYIYIYILIPIYIYIHVFVFVYVHENGFWGWTCPTLYLVVKNQRLTMAYLIHIRRRTSECVCVCVCVCLCVVVVVGGWLWVP